MRHTFKYSFAWALISLFLSGCGGFEPLNAWDAQHGLESELTADIEITIQRSDSDLLATLEGRHIEAVDFFLNEDLAPFARVSEAPFAAFIPLMGLAPGEHRVRTQIQVRGMEEVHKRYAAFLIEGPTDEPTEPEPVEPPPTEPPPTEPPPTEPPPTEPPPTEPPEGTQTINYQEDTTTDFLNPERGWMDRGSGTTITNARQTKSDLNNDHPIGYSVVWTDPFGTPFNGSSGNPFRLDNYKTRDLPQALLDAVDAEFQKARQAGIKLKVRFSYNYSGNSNSDTSLDWMRRHIDQLAPVLNANKDTIASMDAGFLGMWGEWHGSSHLVSSSNPWWQEPWISARKALIQHILDRIDKDVMIGMRQPRQDTGIREYFGSNWQMDLAQRFTGSHQSRVGWYNDCIFTNKSNVGTYDFDHSEARGNLDRATNAWVGKYAATSGETCSAGGGLNSINDGANVIQEMIYMGGPDTLFRKFWADIYNKWRSSGHYNEISRRLGYRLSLVRAVLPRSVNRGGTAAVEFTLKNSGFGKVYNPRPVDLVLVGGGETFTVRLTADARRDLPLAGQSVTAKWTFRAPQDLKAGQTYQLYLRLPDPSSRLEGDVRYTIRLANQGGLWSSSTGRHNLNAAITAR